MAGYNCKYQTADNKVTDAGYQEYTPDGSHGVATGVTVPDEVPAPLADPDGNLLYQYNSGDNSITAV